jgi:hypothetical protein
MPPLVVPNTVQVRTIWQTGGTQFAVNVLHFRNSGSVAVNQTLANQVATDVASAFTTALGTSTNINSTTGINQVRIRNLDTLSQPEFTATVSGAVGTGTAELLPKQVAACVTLRTALAGRSYRGRVYVPGWTEVANNPGGVISPTAMVQADGIVRNIRANLAGRGLTMGVVSTRFNKAPRVINVITDVVDLSVRDNQWDNQRRRNIPGIGA